MTKEQLDFIVAMIAGQKTATVHLSLMFAEQAGVSKDLVAESFRQTAGLLGQDVMNREIIVTVLNQIANGINTSTTEHQKNIEEMVKNVLH